MCSPRRTDSVNARRVVQHVFASADAGADLVMVTCHRRRAVETAATLVNVPVLRVDLPMAEKAVQTGKRIGVIATVRATMEPTADLISAARKSRKNNRAQARLCEGAFDAWMSATMAKHDAIVAAALKELSRQLTSSCWRRFHGAVVEGLAAADSACRYWPARVWRWITWRRFCEWSANTDSRRPGKHRTTNIQRPTTKENRAGQS